MAFEQTTRNRLQRFVNDARRVLEEEFTRQLQNDYGMDPTSGAVTDLASLRHINDAQRETARILRDTLAHYCASGDMDTRQELDRIVREQAFTVLNRLAALRMAETRGLLVESVGHGFQAKGFQLYSRLAGTGLGETGDTYRTYLFSVFDELGQDLPDLFDRYSPQGRLFPREAALLQLLNLLNDPDIAPLWCEDETVGWIYQYFNSKEERKAMREASQAPRNSRELAVRNQFFTPRYVVEFLVDNTLGRLWFDATNGFTDLRERCHYLLVKTDETLQPPTRLRDPRTLKLLDPACGSMHFGLYAFDLFAEIYREAWTWEQQHGPGSLDVLTHPLAALNPLCQTYENQAAYLRDVPRLIIEHNIYGVDIDQRAAQIASLALWLRAQRAWHDAGIKAKDRPLIGRGHVLAAIAPPAEHKLQLQFAATLDKRDAELFEKTLQLLKGLPELGILLQVEHELPKLVRQVYVGKAIDLFAEQERESWQHAEVRLYEALIEFTKAAKSTYQGRLYAQDALQGLRLIDLTREQFDVVVMNPPFGAASINTREQIANAFPFAKGDLLAVFVERAIELLRTGGRVGAITNRSCLFLTSMEDWRDNIVLTQTTPETLADLGAGVMDDAMVEAAAYVLNKNDGRKPDSVCTCIRALAELDKSACLLDAVKARDPSKIFVVSSEIFAIAPSHAFAYWVSPKILEKLYGHNSIESELVSVRVGMQTGDDGRFLRQWWEVDPKKLVPIRNIEDTQKEARDSLLSGPGGWFTYTKTDEASPWFSPLLQVVNWKNSGEEYKHFLDKNRKSRAALRSQEYYLQPGFSYMNRSSRLVPYIFPAGAIPSAGRSQAFGEGNDLFDAYVIAASNVGSACARFTGEMFARPKFQAGMVQAIPSVRFDETLRDILQKKITEEYVSHRRRFEFEEPYREFVLPGFLVSECKSFEWSKSSLLGKQLEIQVASQYGLTESEFFALDHDLQEAVTFQSSEISSGEDDDTSEDVGTKSGEDQAYIDFEGLVSYSVGCAFGRWDIRIARRLYQASSEINPFAPLPLSPPGMLTDECGLPCPSKQENNNYPIAACPTGIIESDTHGASQFISRIRDVFDAISTNQAIDENVISLGLKCRSLEDYVNQPNKFFADHLLRYTAGGRKAPIYWPLSTTSGSYTLWIYYPSLTNQTIYTAINDFIEPKLKQVHSDVAALRSKGLTRTRDDEKQFEALQAFELELTELLDKLLNLAPRYQPNHDDGVQISAAPLWPLFRHKSWQKVLKDTWAKLEKGDYDWAQLSMNYWPERVREKCKTDKSLAIAHHLEHLYIELETHPKKARGKKKTGGGE